MRYWIKVLCNKSRDTDTCLALVQDNTIVLIVNVCDGWQRQAGVLKLKMLTCNNILLTSLLPDSISGLPGFYLTANDAAQDKQGFACTIYGPKRLEEHINGLMLESYPKYWTAKELPFISAAPAVGTSPQPAEEQKAGPAQEPQPFDIDKKVKVYPILTEISGGNCAPVLSYLIQPAIVKGKFKGDEAKKRGLTVEQIKALVAGGTVTLPDGKTLQSNEMFTPPIQPPSIVLLYSPSLEHVHALTKSQQLRLCKAAAQIQVIELVVHSAPYEVLTAPEYIDFVNSFAAEATHLIDCGDLNDDVCPRYPALTLRQTLSQCNGRVFPTSGAVPVHKANTEKRTAVQQEWAKRKLPVQFAVAGFDYGFWPSFEVSKESSLPGFHQPALLAADSKTLQSIAKQISETPNLAAIHQACLSVQSTRTFLNEPMFAVLGTASQKPSKYRCVSGLYMNLLGSYESSTKRDSPDVYARSFGLLLDCGEGTYGQLFDQFADIATLANVLEHLSVIYFSHYHGDHVYGLGKLLKERDNVLKQRHPLGSHDIPLLYLIIPSNMQRYVDTIVGSCDLAFGSRLTLVLSERLNADPERHFSDDPNDHCTPAVALTVEQVTKYVETLYTSAVPEIKNFWQYLQEKMGVRRFHTFDTDHSKGSHGLVIEGGNWKVVYSGDTAPCVTVNNFGRNADLLIHECTFADNLPRKDEDVKHTTLTQCLNIFDSITPWRMLLTHFSNKSNKIATISEEHRKRNMFVAFDHLQFRLSEAEWIPQLTPLLETVILND